MFVSRVQSEQNFSTKPSQEKEIKSEMKTLLKEHLSQNTKYDQTEHNKVSRQLAEQIRNKVKDKIPKQYKVVSFVLLGERKNARSAMHSKSVWEPHCDFSIEASYSNEHFYAVAVVYGLSRHGSVK